MASHEFMDALGSLRAEGCVPCAYALELGDKIDREIITGDEAVKLLIRHHATGECTGPADIDPLGLLAEWMDWWYLDDDAPAKLPNALQVRTSVVLTVHTSWTPPHRVETS